MTLQPACRLVPTTCTTPARHPHIQARRARTRTALCAHASPPRKGPRPSKQQRTSPACALVHLTPSFAQAILQVQADTHSAKRELTWLVWERRLSVSNSIDIPPVKDVNRQSLRQRTPQPKGRTHGKRPQIRPLQTSKSGTRRTHARKMCSQKYIIHRRRKSQMPAPVGHGKVLIQYQGMNAGSLDRFKFFDFYAISQITVVQRRLVAHHISQSKAVAHSQSRSKQSSWSMQSSSFKRRTIIIIRHIRQIASQPNKPLSMRRRAQIRQAHHSQKHAYFYSDTHDTFGFFELEKTFKCLVCHSSLVK